MRLEMGGNDASFLRSGRRMEIPDHSKALRIVDLFAGCGGFTLGLQEAAKLHDLSADIKLACEIDPIVRGVFGDNFDIAEDRLVGDISACFDRAPGQKISSAESSTRFRVGRDLDLVVGGPPCQGHSTLNNHTRGADPKNALYLKMARAAEVLSPRALIIENVPAVQRDSYGVIDRTTKILESLGYQVSDGVVSLSEIGVPQLRRRHVLLAIAGGPCDLSRAIAAGATPGVRDLAWAIGDLTLKPGQLFDDAATLSRENARRARFLLKRDLHDLPNNQRPSCQRGSHKYKSMYGRLRWNEPAQTITSGFGSPGQGRYLHPDKPRTLTPHEAARIQFFPDWFDFNRITGRRALARAIGNAVPSKLSFVLGHYFLSVLKEAKPTSFLKRESISA